MLHKIYKGLLLSFVLASQAHSDLGAVGSSIVGGTIKAAVSAKPSFLNNDGSIIKQVAGDVFSLVKGTGSLALSCLRGVRNTYMAASPLVGQLASDGISIVKNVGSCGVSAIKGIGNVYVSASNHKILSCAIVLASLAGINWYTNQDYAANIGPIEKRAKERLYANWGTNAWESGAAMLQDKPKVLNAFVARFGVKVPGSQVVSINQKILTELQDEIRSISGDIQSLEENYLVRMLPLDITVYNIKGEFGAAKGAHAPKTGLCMMSVDQSSDVDRSFNKTIKGKMLPYLFSLNYGYAAQVWRKLNNAKIRLEVLKSFIEPLLSGLAEVPYAHAQLSSVAYDLNGTPAGTVRINVNSNR